MSIYKPFEEREPLRKQAEAEARKNAIIAANTRKQNASESIENNLRDLKIQSAAGGTALSFIEVVKIHPEKMFFGNAQRRRYEEAGFINTHDYYRSSKAHSYMSGFVEVIEVTRGMEFIYSTSEMTYGKEEGHYSTSVTHNE